MPQQGQQSASGVQWFPGQKEQAARIYQPGGLFEQLLSGAPNAGYERAQQEGLRQLQQRNAQLGLSQQPLGTRILADYTTRATQQRGDNYLSQVQSFMQPAGTQSRTQSSGLLGGPLGFTK